MLESRWFGLSFPSFAVVSILDDAVRIFELSFRDFWGGDGGSESARRVEWANPLSSPKCEVHPRKTEGKTRKGGGKGLIF